MKHDMELSARARRRVEPGVGALGLRMAREVEHLHLARLDGLALGVLLVNRDALDPRSGAAF